MRRFHILFFSFLLIAVFPFLLGNKSCEKVTKWEHMPIEKDQSCSDCHDDNRSRETKPVGHDAAWTRDHGKVMRKYGFKQEGTCAMCHTEATCTRCHQQEKPQNHTHYWRQKGHGLALGLDRNKCMVCHQTDFCERCHANTQPITHNAAWGTPRNLHCLSCHFPLSSVGAQQCAVCHTGTPSHAAAPNMPNNALHRPGANCRSCHAPLRHPDNGMQCTVCHQ